MIIDHIGVSVSDYDASCRFFRAALAPLGITLLAEYGGWGGFGRAGKAEFWFGTHAQPHSPLHLAFLAENRDQVRAFYAAALGAGATDNGPPGIRPQYHDNYYGAYVVGPDGHNLEAACHLPEA